MVKKVVKKIVQKNVQKNVENNQIRLPEIAENNNKID